MRILMTSDPVGGVWPYSLDLAEELARRGIEVALAVMGGPLSPDQRREARALDRVTLFESSYKLEWMADSWNDLMASSQWLLALFEKLAPDLVHLNGYFHGALPWRAPVVVVGHSCVLSWWEAVHGLRAPEPWNAYGRRVATGLRGADLIVAPSRDMLERLERLYGPLSARRVIPNGRHPGRFAPGAKEPIVFGAGRLWDEAKNLGRLAEIAGEMPWPVFLAGEARHPERGGGGTIPQENLQLLGRLSGDEMTRWLARAALYVLPARYEPFGLSPLEAALSGCALILGDIASLREIWEDAACFVPPDDPRSLAGTIRALIENEPRRRRLAALARTRALERYTAERMAEGYLAAYAAAAERSAARLSAAAPLADGGPV